ncbi:SDR family oxidoreductase [Flavisolibacter sp. BT320]|nr:SDR family oxidoreductase [Flavisolibacter longurius]
MQNILLFGATGNLGRQIAKSAVKRGFTVTAVVRNEKRKTVLKDVTANVVVCDVGNAYLPAGTCQGFDIVISALGKSVSPNEYSKASFRQIDLDTNSNILTDAINCGVKKFIYISAFGAEHYPELDYFSVHHQFSEKLKASGLDYAIIKPPALFSAFIDLAQMAKKGMLVTMGKGDKQTNPIYEGDLAQICIDAIQQPNAVIEAGGKEVLTRHGINEIIQQAINPRKKVRKVPIGLVQASLPLVKLFSKNMYDKLAFFTAVMKHDTVASLVGETRLATYMAALAKGELAGFSGTKPAPAHV